MVTAVLMLFFMAIHQGVWVRRLKRRIEALELARTGHWPPHGKGGFKL